MRETIRELRRITGGSNGCGWMCDEVAEFLFALVRFHKPDLVIQTGHLWGKSAAAILCAMEPGEPIEDQAQDGDKLFSEFVEANRPVGNGKLISIDPHPMEVPHPVLGIAYLHDRFPDRLRFVKSKSADFFQTFATDAKRIMGVVDGDHSDAGCLADLESLAKLGANVIVVDDISWIPSLESVASTFAFQHGYRMSVHRVYNGIAVLTRA